MTALERTPMTNDAERVSDIPKPVAWRCFDEGSWMVDTEQHTDWEPLYTADIIEAQSKALAEAREVKPLEWDDEATASTPFGAYTVRDAEGGADGYQWTFHSYPFGVADETVHQSIGKAKTAAQADYEQRILGALVTPTPENPNG